MRLLVHVWGFFHPFFPQNSSSSVDFRAVLHELHFWGEFFDGVSAGGLWWPWLGPFEALHCRILDVFGVIILLQELSSFHLQLVFFFCFFWTDSMMCWLAEFAAIHWDPFYLLPGNVIATKFWCWILLGELRNLFSDGFSGKKLIFVHMYLYTHHPALETQTKLL